MNMDGALLAALFLTLAVLYSSVGHAGASGYLAAMALVGVEASTMRPTALVLNVLVAAIATVRFCRAGCFAWRTLWPFAITSIPLSFAGGAITLPGTVYKRAVGAILVFAAGRLLWEALRRDPASDDRRQDPERAPVPLRPALAWGAAIGLLAGLTGTGGGIFLSPLLLLLGWEETRRVSGVSAAFILVNSLAGLLANPTALRALPPLLPVWAVAVALGGLIGTELGARRLGTRRLRQVLALVLAIAGAKLLLAI